MIISVKNHSRIADEEVLAAVRAVNRQIAEDFEPYWDLGGMLRLADPSDEAPAFRISMRSMAEVGMVLTLKTVD